MTTTDQPRTLRCPRCGARDRLTLAETHEELGVAGPGVIRLDERGNLLPPCAFDFSPGEPIRVMVDCEACGHEWRSRKAVGWDFAQ